MCGFLAEGTHSAGTWASMTEKGRSATGSVGTPLVPVGGPVSMLGCRGLEMAPSVFFVPGEVPQ